MQQATINLFADMGGSCATTAMAGLPTATPSGDTQPPTVPISQPRPRAPRVANGTPVTVTGTATDAGGGRVAAVEVSTDGGPPGAGPRGPPRGRGASRPTGARQHDDPGTRDRRQRQHRALAGHPGTRPHRGDESLR